MDLHSNAKSCPSSRELLIRRIKAGWRVQRAAEAAGISRQTAHKWLKRFREGGQPALHDRPSRPRCSPRAIPINQREAVLRLRRRRMTARQIAKRLKMPRSTVALILARAGLGRLKYLDPREPVIRYQRERPGELLHLDTKKLGRFSHLGHRVTGDRSRRSRFAGWEFAHICIDDATRLAYVEVLRDEKAISATRFLERALAWFQRKGIGVERVLTDNGSCYRSKLFRSVCTQSGIRQLFTRPYRPQTNGKAERFIQTMLREWAYARTYLNSTIRRQLLPRWLSYYNNRRPHASLNGRSPCRALKLIG